MRAWVWVWVWVEWVWVYQAPQSNKEQGQTCGQASKLETRTQNKDKLEQTRANSKFEGGGWGCSHSTPRYVCMHAYVYVAPSLPCFACKSACKAVQSRGWPCTPPQALHEPAARLPDPTALITRTLTLTLPKLTRTLSLTLILTLSQWHTCPTLQHSCCCSCGSSLLAPHTSCFCFCTAGAGRASRPAVRPHSPHAAAAAAHKGGAREQGHHDWCVWAGVESAPGNEATTIGACVGGCWVGAREWGHHDWCAWVGFGSGCYGQWVRGLGVQPLWSMVHGLGVRPPRLWCVGRLGGEGSCVQNQRMGVEWGWVGVPEQHEGAGQDGVGRAAGLG